MSNPSFQGGLLKIGNSSKHPDSFRKEELQTTGVPEPFLVEYSALADDFSLIEQKAHKLLARHRHKSNREFFDVPLRKAIETVRGLIGANLSFEELSDRARMSIDSTGELVTKHANGIPKTVKRYRNKGKSLTLEEYFLNGQMKFRANFYEGVRRQPIWHH